MRMLTLFLTLLFCGATGKAFAAEASLFPITQGNMWIYRDSSTGQTLTIDVRGQIYTGGKVYNKIYGYAYQPMLVREGENGSLYLYNEEMEREELLTSFDSFSGGWYDSRLTNCGQLSQRQEKREEFRTPQGTTLQAVRLVYRNFNCADSGIEEELYLENVGLVRRTVSTIAGPRTYELVYGRAGLVTYDAQRGTAFRVGLDRNYIEAANNDPVRLTVSMRLTVRNAPSHDLDFPSGQLYDIRVRDEKGNIVYQWSDGLAFPLAGSHRYVPHELEFTQVIDLKDRSGAPLAGGYYTVEAWLTTANREFGGATRFFYSPPEPETARVAAHSGSPRGGIGLP